LAPAGEEVTRPFVIFASDGRFEVQADGSIIQSSAERRPLARLLLTLFGALAMILGALLPWPAVSNQRGVDLDVDSFAQAFGFNVELHGAGSSISVGLVIMGLALLMIFGCTSRSGRLSRVAALLGAMLVIGTFVAFAVASGDIMPGRGAILALAGCIAVYIGGLLVNR
jgi:hypothetical protein